jgi:hypothetical protein
LNTGIGTKASPFLEKEGAPRAIKAGFRRAQLLPKRLAAGCEFVTNFNEPTRMTVDVGIIRVPPKLTKSSD